MSAPTRFARQERKTREELENKDQLKHYRVSLMAYLLRLCIVSGFTAYGVSPVFTHAVRLLLWNVHAIVISNYVCLILLSVNFQRHYHILREHQDLFLGVILIFALAYVALSAIIECLVVKYWTWTCCSLMLYRLVLGVTDATGRGEFALVMEDHMLVMYTSVALPVIFLY